MSTKPLKNMDEVQLQTAIATEAGDAHTDKLQYAITLATKLHDGQVRRDPVQGRINTPYIEHCLRNTLRLIRLGCLDEDILVATILHDTVEDCSQVFAPTMTESDARITLRAHILRSFGPGVLAYVDGVTNPNQSRRDRARLNDKRKFELYQAKVRQSIQGSAGVYLVKLTDYIDNAGSLHHTPEADISKARRLARKYLPLVSDFHTSGNSHAADNPDLIRWDEVGAVLTRIDRRLQKLHPTQT